jgi:hypothetical protein
MRSPWSFWSDMFTRSSKVGVWVVFLTVINVAAAFFYGELIARVVLYTFIFNATVLQLIYVFVGYDGLMSIGHLPWIPMITWIAPRFGDTSGVFRGYLVVVLAAIVVSLVFDIRGHLYRDPVTADRRGHGRRRKQRHRSVARPKRKRRYRHRSVARPKRLRPHKHRHRHQDVARYRSVARPKRLRPHKHRHQDVARYRSVARHHPSRPNHSRHPLRSTPSK